MIQETAGGEAGILCCDCICRTCLYWWSSRCPQGRCYDDKRARDVPKEQGHWCRGGIFYPAASCSGYVKYTGQEIRECLEAKVQVFQDGYIACPIVDIMGCTECYSRFEAEDE